MRKYFMFILEGAITLLLLTGCQQNETSSETDKHTEQQISDTSENPESTSQTTEAETDEYVTLVVDNPHMTTQRVAAINQYLEEKNCTYRIKGMNSNEDRGLQVHAKYLEKYIDSGEQIDIVYGAETWFIGGRWSFTDLWKDGYLECMENYMDTEEGKQLYASMPEVYWEALRAQSGGELYGMCGYPYSLKSDPIYFVNTEIMEKYNLTEEDLTKPIGELKPILEEIQSGEAENENFYALQLVIEDFYGDLNLSEMNPEIRNIMMSETNEEQPVTFVLDDEELKERLTDVYSLYQDEQIKTALNKDIDLNNYFILISFFGDSGGLSPVDSGYCTYKYIDVGKILYPYGNAVMINDTLCMNSIVKTSLYKDEAFDFLYRVYTDPTLTDIAALGADLVEEDGRMYHADGSDTSSAGYLYMGNGFIGSSASDEFTDKHTRLKEIYERAHVSEYAGFYVNHLDYSALNAAVSGIADLEQLFTGNYDSAQSYFQEQKQMFTDAGGEDYIEIIREAYDEFQQNQK